jgi:hypothetical protein
VRCTCFCTALVLLMLTRFLCIAHGLPIPSSLFVCLLKVLGLCITVQVIARLVDGSKFDEFKALYGDTLVTGTSLLTAQLLTWC